jgi:hypothetical protein
MTMPSLFRTFAAPLAAVVLLAACGGGDESGGQAAAGGDAAPKTAAPAPPPPPPPADEGPIDEAAIQSYRLEIGKMRRWKQAVANLMELKRTRPEVTEALEMNMEEFDANQVVARINSVPEARRAIESAGISARDYVLTIPALVGALFVHGMREGGMNVGGSGPDINEDNVKFVAEHQAEIEQMMKDIERMDPDSKQGS